MNVRGARGPAARAWLGLAAGAALGTAACTLADPAIAPSAGAPSPTQESAVSRPAATASHAIAGPLWQWRRTQFADSRTVEAGVPERYTLKFEGDGRVRLSADCNRGMATYAVSGSRLTIGPPALTKVMCPPDSQDREFLRQLEGVAGYAVDGDGLVLQLGGGGAMRFRASGSGP